MHKYRIFGNCAKLPLQFCAAGFTIWIIDPRKDQPQQLRTFHNHSAGHSIGGVIHFLTDRYGRLRPYLSRLPTVFVGENLREVPESYVSVDNYRGAYLGVEYLHGPRP